MDLDEVLLVRRSFENRDFIQLTQALDAELKLRDGEDHAFYAQFNKVDNIRYAIIAYFNEQAIGFGALKKYSTEFMEIKRMYVQKEFRGMGLASYILSALEQWSRDLSYYTCILETGINQSEAINLYKKCGYNRIPNYGQYANVEVSLCFEKCV